jgi:hypothetical protein
MTADQKQQRVNVCQELRCNPLSQGTAGDENWIYGYGPETKQQSFQWKCPNSPKPKKARKAKVKVKSMLIIFFDIKGIVHKTFVLAGQTVSHTSVTIYDDCMKMCEDFAPNFGDKRTGCCITTAHCLTASVSPGNF